MNELLNSDKKTIVKILRSKFLNLYEILRRVDQKDAVNFVKKNNYYAENQGGSKGGCDDHGHSHAEVYRVFVPKEELTFKEKALAEITQRWRFEVELPDLLKYLSDRFNNIKQKGIKDWNKEAEDYVLREVLKEGVTAYFLKKLNDLLKDEGKKSSTEHLLIANPTQWLEKFKNHSFTLIDNKKVAELVEDNNFIILDDFINFELANKAREELEFIEMDGRFTRGFQNFVETKEKYLYFSRENVNKKDFPGLKKIAVMLTSLPFELNSKLNYGFQVSETVKACCYGKDFEILSGNDGVSENDKIDIGVCFSVFLFLDNYNNGEGSLIKIGDNDSVIGKKGRMVILKSRKSVYNLLSGQENQRKGFLLQYWISGPKDLNNGKY